MGQTCNTGIFSCVDCSVVNTAEMLSEQSKRFDLSNPIYQNECRDPIVNCVEKLDQPLELYEKEFQKPEHKKPRKSIGQEDSLKVGHSPRIKVMSSNFSEKSMNLINRIDRTAETDKSLSSVFNSSLGKETKN